jgi:hypothetical protein
MKTYVSVGALLEHKQYVASINIYRTIKMLEQKLQI